MEKYRINNDTLVTCTDLRTRTRWKEGTESVPFDDEGKNETRLVTQERCNEPTISKEAHTIFSDSPVHLQQSLRGTIQGSAIHTSFSDTDPGQLPVPERSTRFMMMLDGSIPTKPVWSKRAARSLV